MLWTLLGALSLPNIAVAEFVFDAKDMRDLRACLKSIKQRVARRCIAEVPHIFCVKNKLGYCDIGQ